MKKVLVSILAVVAAITASQAQFRPGIKAGANQVNQRVNASQGSLYAGSHTTGYHAGLIGDIPLTGNFYLQPQLLWSQRGATHYHSTEEGSTQIKIHYIDAPVNIVYKAPLSFGKLFAGAGGAFSYAVAGHQKQNGQKQNLFNSNNWKHEDISLSFTAGLEFNNGLFVSMNSQKGLFNLSKAEGVSVKSKSASISVGYFIEWKKNKK